MTLAEKGIKRREQILLVNSRQSQAAPACEFYVKKEGKRRIEDVFCLLCFALVLD